MGELDDGRIGRWTNPKMDESEDHEQAARPFAARRQIALAREAEAGNVQAKQAQAKQKDRAGQAGGMETQGTQSKSVQSLRVIKICLDGTQIDLGVVATSHSSRWAQIAWQLRTFLPRWARRRQLLRKHQETLRRLKKKNEGQ
jgi:hypothetical protein